jgi:hypothetical protein
MARATSSFPVPVSPVTISGHKTAAIFQRYNIVDERDIVEAGRKLNEKQNANALLEFRLGRVWA